MPILTWPMALWGLAALPGVAVIYILRTRSRRRVVSSLMLWADQRRPRAGGLKLQRIQTPLLLVLELLIVALLAVAAAGPKLPTARTTRPLIVVLDDSFSMQAGGEASPQALARRAIEAELDTGRHRPVQFVLAGARPRVLGRPARTPARAMDVLDGWTCRAPGADLGAATGLASALWASDDAAGKARVLVVTDRAAPARPLGPDVRWRAFGRARGNVAFTAAVRTETDARSRCLIEVANFTDRRQSAVVAIEGPGSPERRTVALEAGATGAIRLDVPAGERVVRATLGADDLAVDNAVTLLPNPQRVVRVDLHVADVALRKALTGALSASGRARLTAQRANLLITDRSPAPQAGRGTWLVQFIPEPDAAVYTGPFITDSAHPLTEGLSLAGVYWAAGKTADLPGRAVIAAGNIPLLSERRRPGDRREIRIRLRPDISTLIDSTNWPVLVWNVLDYRAAALPGLRETNVRLGAQGRLVPPGGAGSVTVTDPFGRVTRRPVTDGPAAIDAEVPGVFKVSTPGADYRFAVNALAGEESDLRQCASGDWGTWLSERAVATEYAPVAWMLVLAALAALVAHAAVLSARTPTRAPRRDGGGA